MKRTARARAPHVFIVSFLPSPDSARRKPAAAPGEAAAASEADDDDAAAAVVRLAASCEKERERP
eukprot:5966174-Prymnesium_polylepis.1